MGFCYYFTDKWCPGNNQKFPLCRSKNDLPEHLRNVSFYSVPTFNDSIQADESEASDTSMKGVYPWLQKDNSKLRLLYSTFDIAL